MSNSFTKPLLHVGPLLSNEDISLIKNSLWLEVKNFY